MKFIFFFIPFLFACNQPTENTKSKNIIALTEIKKSKCNQPIEGEKKATIISKLQGTWTLRERPLIGFEEEIIVKGNRWTYYDPNSIGQSMYNSEIMIMLMSSRFYQFSITNKIPGAAKKSNSSVLLKLIPLNMKPEKDSSYCELLELTDSTMSLIHYPSTDRLNYYRKKDGKLLMERAE
jgi:hypothetical protein